MLANRHFAQRCAPASAGTVFQDVCLEITALHANAEAGKLAIPQDHLAAVRRRQQCIDRSLGKPALHFSLLARESRYHLGTTIQ
jgi:hypothetical protein